MHVIRGLLSLLIVCAAAAGCAAGQVRQRGAVVSADRFPGANICAKIQAAVDSIARQGGGTVTAGSGGDCGSTTQVRVRAGVTLRLPAGVFSYSMRGFHQNRIGALFVLDSDSTLEGAGPSTVIRESPWVWTSLPTEAEHRAAIANGEYIASFKVVMPYASALANGSTSRNITVRNLKIAEGKPDIPSGFNSSGAALDLANCHGCLVENVHMEYTHSIGIQVGGSPQDGSDPGADLAERGVRAPLGRFADNVTVRNCFFKGVASQNLALVNGRNITFENNRFIAPGQPGGPGATLIDLEPNHPADLLQNVVIRNNFIDARETIEIAGNGIVVQATSGTPHVGPILVEGNEIIGGNIVPPLITNKISNGIYVFGATMRDVTVRNNSVTRVGQAGIHLEGTRLTVVNNRLKDVGGGGTPGFRIQSVTDSRITGNSFTYSGNGSADGRMEITGASRNNIIRDNPGLSPPEGFR